MAKIVPTSTLFAGLLLSSLTCLAILPGPIKTDAAWSASNKTIVFQTVKSWVVAPTDVPRISTRNSNGVHFLSFFIDGRYKSFDIRYATNAQMTGAVTLRHNQSAPPGWDAVTVDIPALRANTQYYVQIKAVGNPLDTWSKVFAVKSP